RLDQANVQVEQARLPKAVPPDDVAVDDGAIVLVVGVVLSVEPDDWRIRHPRPREENRARDEATGKIREPVDVQVVSDVALRVRPLGCEIERIERRLSTE